MPGGLGQRQGLLGRAGRDLVSPWAHGVNGESTARMTHQEFPFRIRDEGSATWPVVTTAPVRGPIMHLWALGSCSLRE